MDVFKLSGHPANVAGPARLTLTLDVFKYIYWGFYFALLLGLTLTLDVFKYILLNIEQV